MEQSIAIVGMACCYPDARTPAELWENVLADRRAFRLIPPERLRLEDYFSPDRDSPDSIYSTEACVIEGYEFDRARFRVGKTAYRSSDLAHWLALDIASRALEDAGFYRGNSASGLPNQTTGVFVGNTLTGEVSRANSLRLRWPYVRRVLQAAMPMETLSAEERNELLDKCEQLYKLPFPAVNDETLAGNLSNTIAGRICNHFDLKGGGYVVDGACASSLLAVTNACSALVSGDLAVALAGGVDLSIDPFELVGFAKTEALAQGEMRVFDARSSGFLPGEGCGFVVLMRLDEALRQQRRLYAVIRGWGTSSDGSGGITRPEVEGQVLALQRAYERAGFGIGTVAYFEGHGTGTPVGDETEVRALRQARQDPVVEVERVGSDSKAGLPPLQARVGSIKANIGHTKAAAGIAGLIKTAMALDNQIIPPTAGCQRPHRLLTDSGSSVTIAKNGSLWPVAQPLRAGVSAMGFGGINCHIALESTSPVRRGSLSSKEEVLLGSTQDAELFLLASGDLRGLLDQTERLLSYSARLSRSELSDLSGEMQRRVKASDSPHPPVCRAALIAARPSELTTRLETLREWLVEGSPRRLDLKAGVFVGSGGGLRVGFLFPGQGAPVYADGGALGRRFAQVEDLYSSIAQPNVGNKLATEVAQPAILAGSLAGLRLMRDLGIEASVGVGHSLGEVAGLHWGGSFDERAALGIAAARAAAIGGTGTSAGKMATIRAGRAEVQALLNGDPISIACVNGPRNTVVSGASAAVSAFAARASAAGLPAVLLPVSHPFHSPLIAPAADTLRTLLASETFSPISRSVISTVTGSAISAGEDLLELLCRQVTAPVRFVEAATEARNLADFFIEIGPGNVLSGLMTDLGIDLVTSLDVGGDSIKGLLQVAAVAFASGVDFNLSALFESRFTRPFNLDWEPSFFRNPCEMAPLPADEASIEAEGAFDRTAVAAAETAEVRGAPLGAIAAENDDTDILALIRRSIAERAELPYESIRTDDRLLADLHFNSITVSQMIVEASRRLGLPPPIAPTDYATVTVADMAAALEETRANKGTIAGPERNPAGIASWVRCFTVDLIEERRGPLLVLPPRVESGHWKVFAPARHPFREMLEFAFRDCPGNGVLVALPMLSALSSGSEEGEIEMLLEAARDALAIKHDGTFVLLQHGRSAAGLARSLHLEAPAAKVCVIDTPWADPRTVEWALAEARAASGYTEAHYDAEGIRRSPVLRPISLGEASRASSGFPIKHGDVLLVTGGGKGIAAECALTVAQRSGATLILLGRSLPEEDPELRANLARFAQLGIEFRYVAADVADISGVRRALAGVTAELGPITCILHGAGNNTPALLESLTPDEFRATLAPKVDGLRNVLSEIDPKRLKVLVAFGSLIARSGMRGEAHYSVANERLREIVEAWQQDHTDCRCLVAEWSVWAGVGMGERLGTIDRLAEQGITAIPLEDGINTLLALLAEPGLPVSVVTTSRFGALPTLRSDAPPLPFLRFLEQPRVYCPGIELVADCELSSSTDPYLDDHIFDGIRLFPAVMGLEAMAQAAMALAGSEQRPRFENVRFTRPITVPGRETTVIRIAALLTAPNVVELAVRSAETNFQIDHFRAACRFDSASSAPGPDPATFIASPHQVGRPNLDPDRELYGNLFFHRGRFQRVRRYHELTSTGCIAEIGAARETNWFNRFLPAELALGDPGQRDAAIHSIQVCVPDVTLLPVAVDRIVIGPTPVSADGCLESDGTTDFIRLAYASQTSRKGDVFTYNLLVTNTQGRLLESWEGLQLRLVTGPKSTRQWVGPLLGPYIERIVGEQFAKPWISVVVDRGQTSDNDGDLVQGNRTDNAIRRALGENARIVRRPDGKPQTVSGQCVSASHSGDLTLAVAEIRPARGTEGAAEHHARRISCDVEAVASRPQNTWRDMLGGARFELAKAIPCGDASTFDLAATRVWCANECLKKAGLGIDAPLIIDSDAGDGWLFLHSGSSLIATYAADVAETEATQVFAVLAE
jgi:enediyne polyketide synthase